ncbi:nitrile hydratase accessory protein [Mycobacterium sp. Aquia_216]|uniref:nitrile hydratase accessory protein n=1 Tax=Mycobacterium sp. Aquia_216 TaxID=2991729 RepID=UPI00227A4215|nr:nitrile hydratase accessory protein [Mycobacterium sp. Aquia_216]WAJ43027.1 nitrile hydratase accessory protein [Mycobacterium sp. Aquia_216]
MSSGDEIDVLTYDANGRVHFHEACVIDTNQPQFEADWHRRAFGLAVALSEFGHYTWDDFQEALIKEIDAWESRARASSPWAYYDHWVHALERVVEAHGLLVEGYVGPRDRDEHEEPPGQRAAP